MRNIINNVAYRLFMNGGLVIGGLLVIIISYEDMNPFAIFAFISIMIALIVNSFYIVNKLNTWINKIALLIDYVTSYVVQTPENMDYFYERIIKNKFDSEQLKEEIFDALDDIVLKLENKKIEKEE